MTSSRQRLLAARRGRQAEDAVAAHLANRGYALIGRNVRVGHLELDIVARAGSVVCVVEVRYRGPSCWQGALESIDERKQHRLRRAAEALWQQRFAHDATVDHIRFDVASVTFVDGHPVIEYVEGGM